MSGEVSRQALIGWVRDKSGRQRHFVTAQHITQPSLIAALILMEENLGEPIQLQTLAVRIGLSRRQMERLFHNALGYAPERHYLNLRLEHAKLLLTQTSMPVVEVAIACGFVSNSHFARCFRTAGGHSPQKTRLSRRPGLALGMAYLDAAPA